MMARAAVTKQLAPLNHGNVDEVRVDSGPKVAFSKQTYLTVPTSAEKAEIADEVHAHDRGAPGFVR